MYLPKRSSTIFLTILAFLLLSGCAAPQQSNGAFPSAAPTQALIPSSTSTREPTATRTNIPATSTVTPLPSAVPSTTPTLTPAPQTDFSDAAWYTAGFLSKWQYFFAIQVPAEKIEGGYYALVNRNKEYSCEVLGQYPNRLYCRGPLAAADNTIHYVIYEKDTDLQVFEGDIFVPIQ